MFKTRAKVVCIPLLIAVIFIQIASAATLMTSEQLNELNRVEGKAEQERAAACATQCLIDGGWDPDSGWEPNANSSVACNLKCSQDPCVSECQPQCSTFACIDACAAPCIKAKIDACNTACDGYENAGNNWFLQRCTCICKTGYVPGAGDCVPDDGSGGGCRHNNECQEGYICEEGKCVEDVSESCTEDWECGPNAACENGVCILQFDDECSSDSDCEIGQKCLNGDCVAANTSISLSLSKNEVVLKQSQEVALTAKVEGSKQARVKFTIDDPDFIFSLGAITTSKSISGGIATAKLTFPPISEISETKYDKFPYAMRVTASTELYGKSLSDSAVLTLKSPGPVIKSVKITPSPIKSYREHTIVVVVEDSDSTNFSYELETFGSSKVAADSGKEKKGILVQSAGKTLTAKFFGPEIGFNLAEIEEAKKMGGVLYGGVLSVGFTAAKAGTAELAKRAAEKGALEWSDRLWRWVPVIGKGKTVYGLYQSEKNFIIKTIALFESANWREAMYRGLDMGAEGVRFGVGVVDLFGGKIPGFSKLSDITQDAIDTALSEGQNYLKHYALEARAESAETVHTTELVSVTVEDEDGHYYRGLYDFPAEHMWAGFSISELKEDSANSGGLDISLAEQGVSAS